MSEINHFKVFILCSGDVAVGIDHLHVKRIYLVNFFYIVIEDSIKTLAGMTTDSVSREPLRQITQS
jgi:hypothetical protein